MAKRESRKRARTAPAVPAECPACAGPMVLLPVDDSEAVIEARRAVRDNAAQHERFAAAARAKAEEVGEIHTCTSCGYRARFRPGEGPATASADPAAAGSAAD